MIRQYSFGRMTVNDKEYDKDLKIINGAISSNWIRREGHRLDQNDITDILDARPNILVIGTGHDGNMKVPDSVRAVIERHGITVIVKPTGAAYREFNDRFSQGENVAGAFHLTC